MSETLERVWVLVGRGEYVVSQHGARELDGREIVLDDLVSSLDDTAGVEDDPDAWKGPSVLVLQSDGEQRPVHTLWGLERGTNRPAVLVTAYRPEAARWSADFLRRRL